MGDKITIYQKPTCSKCREALAILKESGNEFESINYYETRLTADMLREIVRKLGIPTRSLLRSDELLAKGLESADDEALLQLMAENPDLIQRPIVIRGDRAIVGRPPERIKTLLKG
ncbi:arsenate reductase family protein [Nitrosomonas sp. HPC101]|uniref:arsenate reductase family protein n=1 Tax=Nitrosomonas sp. HPC101 TaxID=1658667 RepID=UPI0013720E23|nr:arsenate reductase family protein [Nitrosomonas sp. HPC101]MXS86179.1 arsenate reductase family protein [Nitrosomonas sp. HPC101]